MTDGLFYELRTSAAKHCGRVRPVEVSGGSWFFREREDADAEASALRERGHDAAVERKVIGFTQLVARIFEGQIEV